MRAAAEAVGEGSEVPPCVPRHRPGSGTPVIHTLCELFTESVDIRQVTRRPLSWTDMMAAVFAQRQPDGSADIGVDERGAARRARADAGADRGSAAARRRSSRQHEAGKLTARERLDLLLDPGIVRRARRVRHAPRRESDSTESILGDGVVTGHGDDRWPDWCSSSARTSRSSAVRCRRPTPKRSARSWIWR